MLELDDVRLARAAQKVVDAVTHDNGAGGGLISRETIRAVDELRMLLLRLQQIHRPEHPRRVFALHRHVKEACFHAAKPRPA